MLKTAIFAAVLGLAVAAEPETATAGTLNCTGLSTTGNIQVHYDASTQQCTISNAVPATAAGDIRFVTTNTAVAFLVDSDLNGSFNNSDHRGGCSVGRFTGVAAGSNCRDPGVTSGTYTNSVVSTVSAGVDATLSITYTFATGGAGVTNIASATVTGPGIGEEAQSTTTNTAATRAVQAAVSRSQTRVVVTNIGTRLNSIGSPAGVGRAAPAGTGRTIPGGAIPGTPGGGAPTPDGAVPDGSLPTDSPANFANPSSGSSSGSFSGLTTNLLSGLAGSGGRSGGGTGNAQNLLRTLAISGSFDSTNLYLAAVGDETNPGLPQQSRESLLADRPYTIWGHGSYTNVENSRNRSGDDARYSGDVWGYNVGLDYRFRPNLYAGVSVGYSDTDLSTIYNNGGYDEHSYSVTPYAVFSPTEAIRISAMLGYAISDIDLMRDSHAVTGNTDGRMWFGALNATYKIRPQEQVPLDLSAHIGLLATHKTVAAYTESDNTAVAQSTSNTRQVKPGLEAAYSFDVNGRVVQPFLKADYVRDFADPTNGDNDAFDVGGGLRLGDGAHGFSGSIEGQTQLGRDDYREYTISGMVAYGFHLGRRDNPKTPLAEPYIRADLDDGAQAIGAGVLVKDGLGLFFTKFDVTHRPATLSGATGFTAAQFLAEIKF